MAAMPTVASPRIHHTMARSLSCGISTMYAYAPS